VKGQPRSVAGPRLCIECGALALDGPLPYCWDVHQEGAARSLVFSCSSACRKVRGYAERKWSGAPRS